MLKKTCAFTGHRPQKLPWGYDETDSRCIALKEALQEEINVFIESGVPDFFSGMAEGTDQYCSRHATRERPNWNMEQRGGRI